MSEHREFDAKKIADAMSMQNISYFIRLAERLNFTAAAADLYISRQALSKQIIKMESEIGVSLFQRTPSGLLLTEEGQKIYDLYKPLYVKWDQTNSSLYSLLFSETNVLRFAFTSLFSFDLLASPAIELWQKIQKSDVELIVTDLATDWNVLNNNGADLLLSTVVEPDDLPGIETFPIAEEELMIMVSEHHPWYDKKKITKKDLISETLLVFEDRPLGGGRSFLPYIQVGRRQPVFNTNTYILNLKRGKAFALGGTRFSAHRDIVKFLPLPEEYRTRVLIVLAYKASNPLAEQFRKLGRIMKKYLSENYPL